MGYTTDFQGEFTVDPPLTPEHKAYLEQFAYTRRMKRDPAIAETLPDPLRIAVGLPIGVDGGYYVGSSKSNCGQEETPGILAYNAPPAGQPQLWCQWVPTSEDTIAWDENEKFYDYKAWLYYLIEHFLKPWGYTLEGEVEWSGEDPGDLGKLVVKDNVVNVLRGYIAYE